MRISMRRPAKIFADAPVSLRRWTAKASPPPEPIPTVSAGSFQRISFTFGCLALAASAAAPTLIISERTKRMHIVNFLQAAAPAAPQNKFGFVEALQQGGFIAYATVSILGIMSFGSFYILFTKWV